MQETRVIIAGSRTFNNQRLFDYKVEEILSQYQNQNIVIVSGTAKGADQMGERYGDKHNIKVVRFPADWNMYGKSAGYIRNKQMALYAKDANGVLIAFWDGISKGTMHMINLARENGLKVYIVNYNHLEVKDG